MSEISENEMIKIIIDIYKHGDYDEAIDQYMLYKNCDKEKAKIYVHYTVTSNILPNEFETKILKLWHEKKKIQAIKEYRFFYGTGLKESKEAVEKIAGIYPSSSVMSEENFKKRILELCGENRKIQAIKDYRSYFGVGLKEAKDAVNYMLRESLPIISINECESVDDDIKKLCYFKKSYDALDLLKRRYNVSNTEANIIIKRLIFKLQPKELYENIDSLKQYIYDNSERINHVIDKEYLLDLIDQAFDLGYDSGELSIVSEGDGEHSSDWKEGYDEGRVDGYDEGIEDGFRNGYDEGYGNGYDEGYDEHK